MSVGKDLLIKILSEKRMQDFGKLDDRILSYDEKELYTKIKKHTLTYGALPRPEILNLEVTELIRETPYQFYFDEVSKTFLKVEMAELFSSNSILADSNPLEAIKNLREFINKVDVASGSKDIYSMKDMYQMVLEYVQNNRIKEDTIGIPSGWPKLDNATLGFTPGNIYVIVARPKMGKSLTLAYTSIHAYNKGYIPMLISMEMKAMDKALRLIALSSGLPINNLRSGKLTTPSERKIKDMINNLKEQPFYLVEGQFKKNVNELSSIIYGFKPSIVYLDAGYLVKKENEGKYQQKWERMGEIIESFKTVAMNANVPIVITFQFNREVKEEDYSKAGFEHIQLSDAIAQIASVGIGIFKDKDMPQYRRMEVLGGRDFGNSKEDNTGFYINWDWERMDFTEVSSG
ncbi:MAG: hypothetical protein EPN88_13840 [Bacteroidetes bacterium]|nr:MAG: hypothetical protein EPN88_13840 [Bacteroidota bacterium]